ncbi:MAG: hypothetical protein Q8934_14265 [Bacillota bacterium]|nr:hypothetical protein [Bacillota bacterium]
MAYESFKNKLAVRRKRREQITSINKSMNNLNLALNGLVARKTSMDANPVRKQKISDLSQKIQELSKMVYTLAKEKGIQVDDDMHELDKELDDELAKYGYSQEKPGTFSFSDQEKMHTVPAREMTGDSSYDRYGNLGKEIARKYNPHYKM